MKDGSDPPPSPNSTDFRREGRPIIFDPFLESALLSPFRFEAKQTATIRMIRARMHTNERERTRHEREKSEKESEEGKVDR